MAISLHRDTLTQRAGNGKRMDDAAAAAAVVTTDIACLARGFLI